MLSRLRTHITPSTLIATLALLFAMSGGAYAASHYLITSTKQISPKVLKSLTGKAGPAGANGANGAAGLGSAGAQGPAGPGGAPGGKGEPGANGKSVVAGVEAKGANCKEGGANFEVEGSATKRYACNGEKGKEGTFGGTTLPSGKTLKGEWSLIAAASGAFKIVGNSVSFALPLAEGVPAHFIDVNDKERTINLVTQEVEEVTPVGCSGTVESPGAEPGNLCVFAKEEENLEPTVAGNLFPAICRFDAGCASTIGKSSAFGFGIEAFSHEEGTVRLDGTWAVTAP